MIKLAATLLPSFPHFAKYASDKRLSYVRFNSAGARTEKDFNEELELMKKRGSVPIYFDIKGRQLRIMEVYPYKDRLELDLNHPIEVETPTVVLFKAGADAALLKEVTNNGTHLIFDGGPEWMVSPYESLHIRHPSLKVKGPTFLPTELERIEKAMKVGFDGYYLSYVECQRDIDELQEIVGKDKEIKLKIENKKGLSFVANEFIKKDNLSLVAARGDLYVELDKPHEIMSALRLIIEHDSEAQVGSRIMLSVAQEPVPSCADFIELAWLYDIGYRDMLLCDEICLKEDFFSVTMGAFEAFKSSYVRPRELEKPKSFAQKLISNF
jgi:pyruvate kinase